MPSPQPPEQSPPYTSTDVTTHDDHPADANGRLVLLLAAFAFLVATFLIVLVMIAAANA